MPADVAMARLQQIHDRRDVGPHVRFAEGAAVDEAQHGDAGLDMHDLGRQPGQISSMRGRALTIAEDVMDRDVVAAPHDVFAAGIRRDIRNVGQPALERLQRNPALPAGQAFDPLRERSFLHDLC